MTDCAWWNPVAESCFQQDEQGKTVTGDNNCPHYDSLAPELAELARERGEPERVAVPVVSTAGGVERLMEAQDVVWAKADWTAGGMRPWVPVDRERAIVEGRRIKPFRHQEA